MRRQVVIGVMVVLVSWVMASLNLVTRRLRAATAPVTPIVMVPGSHATANRFDQLVTLLNRQSTSPHSLLKVTVQRDGTCQVQGQFRPEKAAPMIVIGFADNADGVQNIRRQANWVRVALTALVQRYQFHHVQFLGHSNGGLALTYFLEHDAATVPVTVHKLMTIAAPYNLTDANDHGETVMLKSLIACHHQLPKRLTVYAVAGAKTYNTDGEVPLASALAGRYIYQGQVKAYTELTVTGSQTQHSQLLQNQQIVQLVRNFMLT
ncbi:alpha/beta hydrolase [Lactiplantibacillus daowaiensis]|uniref:Alpha/beta hydrolase n=1 Tax=Lactiplantibacillus daowaiensis TaxID=2559918 RepID=A0ABW1S2P7_9LACO